MELWAFWSGWRKLGCRELFGDADTCVWGVIWWAWLPKL